MNITNLVRDCSLVGGAEAWEDEHSAEVYIFVFSPEIWGNEYYPSYLTLSKNSRIFIHSYINHWLEEILGKDLG